MQFPKDEPAQRSSTPEPGRAYRSGRPARISATVPSNKPIRRRRLLRNGARGLVAAGSALLALRMATLREPPTLLWAGEFDGPLDLATADHPTGRWRTGDLWQPLDRGYADFGAGDHRCWLANPREQLGGQRYNPFQVRDSVLT